MTKTFETIEDTEMGSGRIIPKGARFREFVRGQDDALLGDNFYLKLALHDDESRVVVGEDGCATAFAADELREVHAPAVPRKFTAAHDIGFPDLTIPKGTPLTEAVGLEGEDAKLAAWVLTNAPGTIAVRHDIVRFVQPDEVTELVPVSEPEFTPTTSADLVLTEPGEFGVFTLPEGTVLQEVPAAELTAGDKLILALGSDLELVAVRAVNGPGVSRGKTLIIERAKTAALS